MSSTELILLILCVVFVIGVLPVWPYSRNWGYVPGGALFIIVAAILIFTGHIHLAIN